MNLDRQESLRRVWCGPNRTQALDELMRMGFPTSQICFYPQRDLPRVFNSTAIDLMEMTKAEVFTFRLEWVYDRGGRVARIVCDDILVELLAG